MSLDTACQWGTPPCCTEANGRPVFRPAALTNRVLLGKSRERHESVSLSVKQRVNSNSVHPPSPVGRIKWNYLKPVLCEWSHSAIVHLNPAAPSCLPQDGWEPGGLNVNISHCDGSRIWRVCGCPGPEGQRGERPSFWFRWKLLELLHSAQPAARPSAFMSSLIFWSLA